MVVQEVIRNTQQRPVLQTKPPENNHDEETLPGLTSSSYLPCHATWREGGGLGGGRETVFSEKKGSDERTSAVRSVSQVPHNTGGGTGGQEKRWAGVWGPLCSKDRGRTALY